MSEDQKENKPIEVVEHVRFAMARTGQYRSIHVDGAWASIDHYGKIHLTLFNEHPPIPRFVTQDFSVGKWVQGSQKFEIHSELQNVNVVREMEADVVMTIEAAKVIRDVLSNFISIAEASKRPDANETEETI